MPQILRQGAGDWSNYHATVKCRAQDRIDLVGNTDEPLIDAAYFQATAALFKQLIAEAIARNCDVRPIGGAWSFSDLARTDGAIVQTLRSGATCALPAGAVRAGAVPDPRLLVLAAGGTRIGQLNDWLDANGLSLKTSGASDGQSLAGALASGTHGSVPAMGGIQNHLRGIHLVVSPTESIWLEPAGPGVLSDAYARSFTDRVVRDDALFAAAAVHLGGLGYVNAVLLEVAESYLLEVVQQKRVIDPAWIADLAAGNFRAVAARMGHDEEPYFYQVILNPFGLYRKPALHRLMLKRPPPDPSAFGEGLLAALERLIDPLALASEVFRTFPLIRGPAIALMMDKMFKTLPQDPAHPLLQTWPQTTPPHKNAGKLFSTGFAIPRDRLPQALDLMLGAFAKEGGGDIVTTLRFVGKSAGTMAFTRFTDNVVIDFDGFRSEASRRVTQAAAAALDSAAVPYSRHWGKMAPITAAIVARDYGPAAHAWRSARETLLPPQVRAVFAGTALRDWGLA